MSRKPWKGNYMVFTETDVWSEVNKKRHLESVTRLIGVYPSLREAEFIKVQTIKRVTHEYHEAVRLGKSPDRKKVVVIKSEAKPTSTKVGSYLSYLDKMSSRKENVHG